MKRALVLAASLALAACAGTIAPPRAPGATSPGVAIERVAAHYQLVKLMVDAALLAFAPAELERVRRVEARVDAYLAAARTAATIADQAAALAAARAEIARMTGGR